MTTNAKNTPTEPLDPQKKGGGDGNAKSAKPESRPMKTQDKTNSSGPAAGPALRSRKITSRG